MSKDVAFWQNIQQHKEAKRLKEEQENRYDAEVELTIRLENEALDYEEISMTRLTKLKMHYPSLTRVNDSDEATIFENTFKRKNK